MNIKKSKKPHSTPKSPKLSKSVTGIIRVNKNGTGFIDINSSESIIIPNREINGAVDRDTVKVKILPKRKPSPNSKFKNQGDAAQVVEIIKRGTEKLAGIIQEEKGLLYLKPIKKNYNFRINLGANTNSIKPGTGAVANITSWQNDTPGELTGNLVCTFGTCGEHENDMSLILSDALESPVFTKEVTNEADNFSEVDAEKELHNTKRKDFRNITTFTIDPATARDFDDALSIQELSNNIYQVGIHIADVAHYIKEKKAIDTEAYRRGTSIYLVDRCVPMLPENLSNNLCSLVEGIPRLTMSVVVDINTKGEVLKTEITEGLIVSNKRFTYEEVDEIMEKNEGLFIKEITILNNISRELNKKRIKRGAFMFERDEFVFNLDKDGTPISIDKKQNTESHTLIESFMLLANQIIADQISTRQNGMGKKAGMYRIHEDPTEGAITDLILSAKLFGIKTPMNIKKPRDIMNYLLEKSKGLPMQDVINESIIRAQAKAVYSEENKGHFGLALKSYCHFTSPIRRYPDLVVHRILKSMMNKEKFNLDKKELSVIGTHTSEREVRASEAERASIRYKQIQYLENYVGKNRQAKIIREGDFTTKVLDTETNAVVECTGSISGFGLGSIVTIKITTADRLQDTLTGEFVK
jgi:ribonuclease R